MSLITNSNRKGIILAGGTGSRLFPITKATCKQLLPIYDKPMIYYSLSTLMLAGIKDILIITTKEDKAKFESLLGNGSYFGISISYEYQNEPKGIVQAFTIGEDFIDNSPTALILGDNLFYGQGFSKILKNTSKVDKSTIFAYQVADPERYGVVSFSNDKKVIGIEEKPKFPKSNFAITGLYFYDSSVVEKAKKIKPSDRGELEISDLNLLYLEEQKLNVVLLSRGMAWLDTGTVDSLHEASSFIKTLENRQGIKIGCPEEIAWREGWISNDKLVELSKPVIKSGYGNYLLSLLSKNQ
tara:strand:+ start:4163 stop:5056 length:894 start_codon:yes stop_codon:yes gene_type:complete